MQAKLDFPRELLREARAVAKVPSNSKAVAIARHKFVRRSKIEMLKNLFGKVEVEIDLDRSRRRPS